eukprot:37793-Pleurochrysis_carterae.AAC.1
MRFRLSALVCAACAHFVSPPAGTPSGQRRPPSPTVAHNPPFHRAREDPVAALRAAHGFSRSAP